MNIELSGSKKPDFALVKALRTLIGIEIALTTAGIISEYTLKGLLPENLRNYHAQSESNMALLASVSVILLILVLVLLIVSWIQLWNLKPDGRRLYSVAWACSLPLVLPLGPFIESGVTYVLNTLSSLAGGMTLGILYFSDLRSRFK